MRVLFLCPAPPWPPRSGGRLRTSALLRALRNEVAIDLWSVGTGSGDAEAERALRELCANVRVFPRSPAPLRARLLHARPERWFHSQELVDALARPGALEPYDLVHVDELALLRALPARMEPPIVVHHHKLDRELARALGEPAWELLRWRRLERLGARRSRHHVVCSRPDAGRLAHHHPGLALHVVESGVDPDEFHPLPVEREPGRLLFLGSLAYPPNLDGLRHFRREVWPRLHRALPGLRLRIVGERPDRRVRELGGAGIELVGELADVRQELARASLLVAPLRIGGGTRLKIPCALAAGCPVVGTSTAAEGLELRDPDHLRIADHPAELAEAILGELGDPPGAADRAARGRAAVLEQYGWERLAAKLVQSWEAARASGGRGLPELVLGG